MAQPPSAALGTAIVLLLLVCDAQSSCQIDAESRGWWDRRHSWARVLRNGILDDTGGAGFNIWRIDEASCSISAVELNIDFFHHADANPRLESALSSFQAGEVAAVAVADTPIGFGIGHRQEPSPAAISLLQGFGAQVTTFSTGRTRDSYCLIGRKGSTQPLSEFLPQRAELTCSTTTTPHPWLPPLPASPQPLPAAPPPSVSP